MKTDELNTTFRFLQLENVRLADENQQLWDEVFVLRQVLEALVTMLEVTTSVGADMDVLGLLDRILELSLSSIRAEDGSLLLVDEETNELVFVVVHGDIREQLLGYRIPLDAGISGWAATHAQSVIVPDVRLDMRFLPDVDQTFHFSTRTIITVPIIHDGQVLGVLSALNKAGDAIFDENDLILLELVAFLGGIAMAKMDEIA